MEMTLWWWRTSRASLGQAERSLRRWRRPATPAVLPVLIVLLSLVTYCTSAFLARASLEGNRSSFGIAARRRLRAVCASRQLWRTPLVPCLAEPEDTPTLAVPTEEEEAAKRKAQEASLEEMKAVSPETWLSGEVNNVAEFGVYVSVQPPSGGAAVNGLVHQSKLGQRPDQFSFGAFYVKGAKVKVRILAVMDNGRLELSTAKIGNEAEAFLKIDKATTLVGKVLLHQEELGTFLEVQHPDPTLPGAVGLLHRSQSNIPLDQLKCGEEIRVLLLGIDNARNRLRLTSSAEVAVKDFQEIDAAAWLDAVVEKKLTNVFPQGEYDMNDAVQERDYGFMLKVSHPDGRLTMPGLLHFNDMRSKEEMQTLSVGQVVKVRVLGVNKEDKRLSLSTVDISAVAKEVSLLQESMASGEFITGTVENVIASGVIVRVQAKADDPESTLLALLHVSQMTRDQLVHRGDAIKVRVMHIDVATKPAKVYVTSRSPPLSEQEWEESIDSFTGHEGEFFPARVLGVGNSSALVSVKPPLRDDVGADEGDPSQHEDVVGSVRITETMGDVTVGQDIEVRTDMLATRFIYFSTEPLERRVSALVQLRSIPDTEWLDAKVVRIISAGAIVNVLVPGNERTTTVEGLVPLTRLLEGRVPSEAGLVLKKGQQVTVRVEKVELGGSQSGVLWLTMLPKDVVPAAPPQIKRQRTMTADPDTFRALQAVSSSEWLKGQVVGVASFGAFVAVSPPGGGVPLDGLVRLSQIKEGILPEVSLELYLGQQVDVRILNITGTPGSDEYRLELTLLPEGVEGVKQDADELAPVV